MFLGSLPGGFNECGPTGVNDNGEVVGSCQSTDNQSPIEPFTWTPGAGMVGLPPPPRQVPQRPTGLWGQRQRRCRRGQQQGDAVVAKHPELGALFY